MLHEGKDLTECCTTSGLRELVELLAGQYGGMKANEAEPLRELEAENARLKKPARRSSVLKPAVPGIGQGALRDGRRGPPNGPDRTMCSHRIAVEAPEAPG
jgi:hypothetical protein